MVDSKRRSSSVFTFTGILLRETEGYSSLCPGLDVASFGATSDEVTARLLEAATLYLEGAFEDGLPYLRPVPTSEDPRKTDADSVIEVFKFRVDVAVNA